MEVCIDSIESASNAERGGAMRVELCANLTEGGTTPSMGLLRVVKSTINIPVFVMIRPRGGDFCYSESETRVMEEDIKALKEAGADGFVFGALTCNGDVDEVICTQLLGACSPLPATFHRAIDMSRDMSDSLSKIIKLGFSRVLTSGGCQTALMGVQVIRDLVKQASNTITVMPGGGITSENLEEILYITKATEFHGTARCTKESAPGFRKAGVTMGSHADTDYTRKVTSAELVALFLRKACTVWQLENR